MQSKTDKALADFDGNYNCCQSVIKQFSEDLGISEEFAIKTAAGFGGGMRCGHTCGVITGSIMVLGLKYGKSQPEQSDKEELYRIVKEFTEAFVSVHGATHCKDLIGYDTGTDEGRAKASAEGRFKERCPLFIKTAISLLEEYDSNPI